MARETQMRVPAIHRFWQQVKQVGDCWEFGNQWGPRHPRHTYEQFQVGGRIHMAHRFAWEMVHGPIPQDREIDHLCRNRRCVRHTHLELVTRSENLKRIPRTVRHTCKNGHPWTVENRGAIPGKPYTKCLPCEREAQVRYRAKKGAR